MDRNLSISYIFRIFPVLCKFYFIDSISFLGKWPVNVIWKSNHIHSIWKIESNQNAKRIEFDLAFKNNIFKNEIKSIKIKNFKIKSKFKKKTWFDLRFDLIFQMLWMWFDFQITFTESQSSECLSVKSNFAPLQKILSPYLWYITKILLRKMYICKVSSDGNTQDWVRRNKKKCYHSSAIEIDEQIRLPFFQI